jgi:Zn-dependent metalloprotease
MKRLSRVRFLIVLSTLFLLAQIPLIGASGAEPGSAGSDRRGSAARLSERSVRALRSGAEGAVFVSFRESTGVAGFVRTGPRGDLFPGGAGAPGDKARGFLREFGGVFGIRDTSQLKLTSRSTDRYGSTHLTFEQVYRGVPVFGAVLRVHLDGGNQLTSANGVFVPDISIGTTPGLSPAQARRLAIAEVVADPPLDEDGREADASARDLRAEAAELLVYRTGLIRDVAGSNQLAYRVVVTNGTSVREVVFIHAHAGKILNRYSEISDVLFRRLFEQQAIPANQIWQEGDPFPGSLNQDQQNIVNASGDAYHFFFNAFGRDSYDAAGAEMRSVNNDPTINCPNANWNGATTNYCNGVTADDVVAHEWGHAYTQYTHDLIYQWQSGALNESYSDIWGETVDFLNARGTDINGGAAGDPPRASDDTCSTHTLTRLFVMINSPESIAGFCTAREALFGPQLADTGPITGDLLLANDGVAPTSNGCEPLQDNASDQIVLVDRGTCAFTVKVANAQDAGAIGVLVADNVWGPPQDPLGGADASIEIPAVRIPLGSGITFKSALATDIVNVTMQVGHAGALDTYRWLEGEDATAFGTEGAHAIRDMWNPRCVQDPGRVTDAEYWCSTLDGGGVHTNSGIPNHGYALLVDGGTYNGHTVGAIGLTKAAHLYFQAQSVYQTPTSDFDDHADALQASCIDLIGQPLNALSTAPGDSDVSTEVFDAGDCGQVDEMIAAVELRIDPAQQCNFQPVLQPGAPDPCADTGQGPVKEVYLEDFEAGVGNWDIADEGVFAGRTNLGPFPWVQDTTLPAGRLGAAAFAVDPPALGNCDFGAGDVSGHTTMTSAPIEIPDVDESTARMSFEHYVATEAGWDGGNLKVSINGGSFVVPPDAAYTFNPYNVPTLNPAPDNTNPLAGQDGWTGTDGGEVTSSWGESQLNLAALGVVPGDTIQLQFDFGIDGCTGIDGWYVDNVHVYLCVNADPTIVLVPGGRSDGQRAATINVEVGDAETEADDLVLSGASDNEGVVANSGFAFGGTDADRTVSITGVPGSSGTAIVTITVRDEGGGTASITLTVIIGGGGADELEGTPGPDVILGGGGDDSLFGFDDIDLLAGWNGDDSLDGGSEDDTLFGDRGDDTLTGGAGGDVFSGGQGDDVLTDFNAGEGDTGGA